MILLFTHTLESLAYRRGRYECLLSNRYLTRNRLIYNTPRATWIIVTRVIAAKASPQTSPFPLLAFRRADSDGELTGVYQKSGHARRREGAIKFPWILMNEVRNQFRAVTNYVVRTGTFSGELRWRLSQGISGSRRFGRKLILFVRDVGARASYGNLRREHTRRWRNKSETFDKYIFLRGGLLRSDCYRVVIDIHQLLFFRPLEREIYSSPIADTQ